MVFWQQYKKVVFAVTAVGAIILVVTNSQAIHNQLDSWKLLPRPERITELYFTDHTKLPTTYAPGDNQTVAFTVHNLEYRDTKYTYAINQTSADGKQNQLLATGALELSDNQTRQISKPIALTNMGNRSKINVTLSSPSSTETINYYLTEVGV